ncbi:MAG: dUTP diphosphatase [Gammaproteobacteria bacterium]|nr:MAG: dUTP diphosphatase [Gammaproteobacteria bacterium]
MSKNRFWFNPSNEGIEPPKQATTGSAGIDLRADLKEPVRLYPGAIEMIATGVYSSFNNDVVVMVCSRSGLASKGIAVANAPGIVDSDYRGEIKVLLINHSADQVVINPNERIAQMVPVSIRVDDFDIIMGNPEATETERGAGGFGSTGVE